MTLNIETKIKLLKNLNSAMIVSKRKIYDLNNFDKGFVKSNDENPYYHAILYVLWIKEKNILLNQKEELNDSTIKMLEVINKQLDKFRLEYSIDKQYNRGVNNMINKSIIIKKIKDYSNGGIYYLTDKEQRKILSSDGEVVGFINCMEKINILNIIIDNMLNNKFNENKKDSYDKIFSNIFDKENISLESDINILYSKVILSFYKPKKDMKKIKSIKDSIVKCTFIEENTDYKVKYLINERVCYM